MVSGHRIHFFNGQTAKRLIKKHKGLCILRVDGDGLRLGRLVDHIAGSCLDLLGNDSPGHAGNADFSLIVRGVQAIGGQIHDFELGILERNAGIDGA